MLFFLCDSSLLILFSSLSFSDGFRQAWKYVKKDTARNSPRSWRDWINRQETWDAEADRCFNAGYFSLAIDLVQRSLMLGGRKMEAELKKPFGGDSASMVIAASHRWWKAAVCARHLGELHTSLKACEEAVQRDPSNALAAAALEKWNAFFLDGQLGDDAGKKCNTCCAFFGMVPNPPSTPPCTTPPYSGMASTNTWIDTFFTIYFYAPCSPQTPTTLAQLRSRYDDGCRKVDASEIQR